MVLNIWNVLTRLLVATLMSVLRFRSPIPAEKKRHQSYRNILKQILVAIRNRQLNEFRWVPVGANERNGLFCAKLRQIPPVRNQNTPLNSLTLKAFAKINLGLHVLQKRDDGYHDLETVFLKVGWHDSLTFFPSNSIDMTSSDPELRSDGGNLCIQAARALALAADCNEGVRMNLDKRLPFGAGLGGGSSDAAVTLQACKTLWQVDIDLIPLAEDLGSDVAFFLGEPIAFGEGRGERLSSLSTPIALLNTHLLIVVPNVAVSTVDAYGSISPRMGATDLHTLVSSGSLEDWRSELINHFEESVFPAFPEVASLKSMVYGNGAAYAAMSGSGSAIFGIFTSSTDAERALEKIQEQHPSYRGWTGPAIT